MFLRITNLFCNLILIKKFKRIKTIKTKKYISYLKFRCAKF